MRSPFLLTCSIVVGSILGGCSSRDEATRDTSTINSDESGRRGSNLLAPDRTETESVVVRAKYYQTTGPCIDLGGGALGMPIIDAFEVVELLQGDLPIERVFVTAMTEGGANYPKGMEAGKIYTLRLTPSERAKKQLVDSRNDGHAFIWIDGGDISEKKAAS